MKAEIYGKDGCSYCLNAETLCISKSIEYKYYNLNEDSSFKEQLLSRMEVPPRTVPQIFIDNIYIGGFTEFYEYINNKG